MAPNAALHFDVDAESGPSGLDSHPIQQRREEIEILIADVERGQALTKKDVVARLGKPDRIQETGSKEFVDRYISTTYHYALAPGEYHFPGSERANVRPGWEARFLFNERLNHGPSGRLDSVIDDTVPLSSVLVSQRGHSDLTFLFPASRRGRLDN